MFTSEDELRLFRYLLDDLPQSDREGIEEKCLLDEEWFEQLQAMEAQLIRDYLKGDLDPEQRRRFQAKYLQVPDLKRKVYLRSEMTDAANPAVGASPHPTPPASQYTTCPHRCSPVRYPLMTIRSKGRNNGMKRAARLHAAW